LLEVSPLGLDGLFQIRPSRHPDSRGFFSEVWSREGMEAAGIGLDFVQDNHSYSAARGVLRGLHFQAEPAAQEKLIRVSRGAIFDVVVDIRRGSPTFGRWVSLEISAALWNQLFVPKGFAHGFVTLEEHSEVQYKVTAPYRPDLDRSIRFDDPDIGIDWPIAADQLLLSDADLRAPFLASIETGF
jgi:dTDP-4-dehydrorhamnose 3,5-epimerase